jgi:hypothetical protein
MDVVVKLVKALLLQFNNPIVALKLRFKQKNMTELLKATQSVHLTVNTQAILTMKDESFGAVAFITFLTSWKWEKSYSLLIVYTHSHFSAMQSVPNVFLVLLESLPTLIVEVSADIAKCV